MTVQPQAALDAFDELARRITRQRAEYTSLLFVVVFGVALVAGQLSDAPMKEAERFWLPLQMGAAFSCWALLRFAVSDSERSYGPVLGIICATNGVLAWAGGTLLGIMGGLDGPFFYGVYTLPTLVIALPCGLRARIGVTLAILLPFMAGYFVPHPEYLEHPAIHIPAIYILAVTFTSILSGHWVHILLRDRFLLTARIEDQAEELAKHNAHLTEEVEEKDGVVRELAERIATVRIDERSDLARTLHDDLGQLIVGARMELGNLEASLTHDEAARAEMVHLRGIVDALSASSRRIVGELRVPGTTIAQSLDTLLAPIRDRSGLRVDTDVDATLDPSEPIREVVYRTVQEGMTNVLKHADATHASVRVTSDAQELVVAVVDDGNGLGPGEDSDAAWGLVGLRERAEKAGGALQISSDESGTRLEVRLPLG